MNKKTTILLFAIFVVLLLIVSAASFIYVQNIINKPYNSEDNIKREFTIQSGQSVKQIAVNLENKNLINGKDFFKIYVWQNKLAARLQAGSYDLSPSMTIPEIVDLFVVGKVKNKEVSVLFREGLRVEEIDRKLAENGLIGEGELAKYDKSNNLDISKYEFLKDRKESGFEGFYFPDTYKFYKDSTVEDIVKKMLDNFDKKLSLDLREEIKKQNKSVFETIVLASIVEKEAKFADDLKKIASVFQNRIKFGKPLESDATINYITGSGRPQSTFEDLKIDSPYNTYKYPGLPPAPISNPGIEAIKAVIYPEKTDYLYFLTTKEGKAIFSKTYEEHLKNKAKYLQ